MQFVVTPSKSIVHLYYDVKLAYSYMEYKSTYFISKDFFLVVLKQILFKIKKNKKPSYNISQTKFMDLKKNKTFLHRN